MIQDWSGGGVGAVDWKEGLKGMLYGGRAEEFGVCTGTGITEPELKAGSSAPSSAHLAIACTRLPGGFCHSASASHSDPVRFVLNSSRSTSSHQSVICLYPPPLLAAVHPFHFLLAAHPYA